MIEVEKMGKPGVPIVSGRFEGDAIASSRAFGMPELKFVIVPRIYRNLPLDECVSQTELAFEEIVSTPHVERRDFNGRSARGRRGQPQLRRR